MLHLLFNPFGWGVLAGAGGLWLAKKYETQTRRVIDDVTTKGTALIGKVTSIKSKQEVSATGARRKARPANLEA